MSCDEQWLPHLHHVHESSPSWNHLSFIEDAHGLQDSYEWLNSHGNYDTNSLLVEALDHPSGESFSSTLSWDTPPAQNDGATKIEPNEHDRTNKTSSIELNSPSLHWAASMSTAAHSNFFGLDINVNNSFNHLELTSDMVEQAQKTLQSWTDLTSKPSSDGAEMSKSACSDSSPKRSTTQNSPIAKSTNSKVTKTFHFVANSDKKTATRLRNTLASRNLRQSKVNRIAQLEKQLEKQLQETEIWQRRAIEAGWKE